ncbi:class I SAM-dependent methyltransferase [Candidatus Ferrigenium straubiae]|uniref:class I SAM-dependent methyltransferase n=1 Tax=Candidatus Ferrigenium straubiae TaxID=2919506 RepID=UPI003F4A9604
MAEKNDFLEALEKKARMFYPSAHKAYEHNQDICDWLLFPLSRWAREAYGEEVFEHAVKGYAQYCMHVSQAQRKYEQEGKYTPESLPDIIEHVYEDSAYMTPYMWAAILIYAFWESMANHIRLFRDEFLDKLPATPTILELACGHGVMGLAAIEHRKDATLTGYDISPTAIGIARKLAGASGHADRACFAVKDVLTLDDQNEAHGYHGIMAAMLAEHLQTPHALFASISRNLKPGGLAFFSTALESPQRDHVYEFHKESEAILMAEEVGLRVIRLVCDSGNRLPGGRFLPRAMAMVLTKDAPQ